MTLIHTALLSEAQAIVERYNLQLIQKNPRVYKNHKIVLVVAGIGKENTLNNLPVLFDKNIDKAINIGIVGCSDENVKIGELFCTNQELENIKNMTLVTVDIPQVQKQNDKLLFDMEAKYFEQIALEYLVQKDIYIFKVVSDHLDDTVPKKDFVKKLIADNLEYIDTYI
jgi:nucleoside phosphorylase